MSNLCLIYVQANRVWQDTLYGCRFFEAYYEAFVKQVAAINHKFVPRTPAGDEELLSFKADM